TLGLVPRSYRSRRRTSAVPVSAKRRAVYPVPQRALHTTSVMVMRAGTAIMLMLMFILMFMFVSRAGVWAGDRGGRGQDEATVLDPLGADQAVGYLTDRPGRPAEQDPLEAAAGVEVNVSGRDDPVQVKVLEFGQPLGDPAGVMVVDQRDDSHRLAGFVGDRL